MRPFISLSGNTGQCVREFARDYFRADIPRSPAYAAGFETAVHARVINLERTPSADACPHPAGSTEADAWAAGHCAGRDVYLDGVH